MKILMIEVPTAERDGSVPFGVLYASSSALRRGHEVKILDLVKDGPDFSRVRGVIESYRPHIIGMGGITSSYYHCKELTGRIKENFPDIPVIVGGVLSSVADLLLERAAADFVVHGEAEESFINLIEAIEKNGDFESVRGISFLLKGRMRTTGHEPQIASLDDIPFPEFGLLEMERYLEPVEKWVDYYFGYDADEHSRMRQRLSGARYFFPIVTARGCTHRCIFCYRHQGGWRQHSAAYVVELMRYLRDKYGVGVFQISDELTTADRRWVMEFCGLLRRSGLGVHYVILSSRVDNVDAEILAALKSSGCLMINYGYESGSNRILDEIRKGTTREAALKAGLLTKSAGIKNLPEIIIGFPSETKRTIRETADFLRRLDAWPVSINTPIPFPSTRLWEIAVERGLIKDKEEFVLNYRRRLFLNFTSFSDRTLSLLVSKLTFDVKLNWLKNRRMYLEYIKCLLAKYLVLSLKALLPGRAYSALKKRGRWNILYESK